MDEANVVAALSALAHQHRLRIFRLLVVAGPNGIPAGEIAESIGVSPTALTFHLKELEHAGLITSARDGRYVRYAMLVDGMRQLLTYLTEDCCQGHPEFCGTTMKKGRVLCKPKERAR
ncbi:helix-turn-helix transcriptional regulator [Hyphomicrobium sp. ghe19]|uniref:ArsR/SmtB family transcription factor n=1 Tax=Hyphomicrobium sp. ghe19 TaxID=2682968 RepID=UPI001366B727|nr:putative HTH-type transcriptional regulator YgaV [Hyphomicrobium sp. ghe19]